jgi:prepilin-type N-terminal cleavage/methylation domain-containing protein
MHARTRKWTGFTLIELLVVVAILVILAAILFPVFSETRDKARQAACLSNMRQIGTATMMYAQDYDETYPHGGSPVILAAAGDPLGFAVPGPAEDWDTILGYNSTGTRLVNLAADSMATRLRPYNPSVEVYLCPNTPRSDDPRLARGSYFWNGGISHGTSCPTYPNGLRTQTGRPLTLAEVPRPSLLQMVDHAGWVPHELLVKKLRMACFADGHFRYTHWNPREDWQQTAWYWNTWNPRVPLDVEKPCSPTCPVEAAALRGQ